MLPLVQGPQSILLVTSQKGPGSNLRHMQHALQVHGPLHMAPLVASRSKAYVCAAGGSNPYVGAVTCSACHHRGNLKYSLVQVAGKRLLCIVLVAAISFQSLEFHSGNFAQVGSQ